MKYSVIIPAYCPDRHLIEVLENIQIQMVSSKVSSYEIIVVDDGSPESCAVYFSDLPEQAIVLHHENNMGKGAAIKTALRFIKMQNEECVIVTVDADGQHLSRDILSCINNASLNTDSLILGSRNLTQSGIPVRSYLGNHITETVFRLATGTHIRDTQTGLRAYHSSLLDEMLSVEGERYEYEMNQLLYAVRNNITIKEVPITTVYEGKNETSHFNTFTDSYLIYKKLLKFALSSISSFLVDYMMFAFFCLFFTGSSGLVISNVLARVISAGFNYELNRNLVFRDTAGRSSSLPKYIALAAAVLVLNTCLLYLLNLAGIPLMAAKIFTEMCMFFFSWAVQKTYIFNSKAC